MSRCGTNASVVPAFDTTLAVYFRAQPQTPTLNNGGEYHNTEDIDLPRTTSGRPQRIGFDDWPGLRIGDYHSHGASIEFRLRNGVPFQISEAATPLYFLDSMDANGGVFAGDQWNLKRLTLSLGTRWEFLRTSTRSSRWARAVRARASACAGRRYRALE